MFRNYWEAIVTILPIIAEAEVAVLINLPQAQPIGEVQCQCCFDALVQRFISIESRGGDVRSDIELQ